MLFGPRRHPVVRRGRGAFIGLVGPDGSGKTTVAAEIERQCASVKRRFAYVHWRPSLTAPFGHPDPHAIPVAKVAPCEHVTPLVWVGSLARLLRSALAFNIAYLARIRPQVRAGTVVVVDRWIYNYISQPNSVRYYGPRRVAAFVCGRLVAQPRPVFVFEAPVSVIRARSLELTEREISSEYERIHRDLRIADLRRIDATATPPQVAAAVLSLCGLTDIRST